MSNMSNSTSLRLLLEDFLGLMREEGELDVFLSLLMSSMGHEVIYRAKKGGRQYGVDISSVGVDEKDGKKKLFLWVVKRGDIGRSDWNGGHQQAILPSLQDLAYVYLRSHVTPQHAKLPKKVVVLTNGDFQPVLNETIAQTFKEFAERHGIEMETANGSRVASWAEQNLLDEHLLPQEFRTLLRRMLANIATPELSLRSGRELILKLSHRAAQKGGSEGAQRKRQLVALRGIRTALSLAQIYGVSENSTTTAYRLAEFSLLTTWALLHLDLESSKHLRDEVEALRIQWVRIAFVYHSRLERYYNTEEAFASSLDDSLLVAERTFEELALLALQGYFWGYNGVRSEHPAPIKNAIDYVELVETLLKTHGGSASPPYDHHSTAVHMVFLALLTANRRESAQEWLTNLMHRLAFAARNVKFWPLSCDFEDALAIRSGSGNEAVSVEEATKVSTLVPVLLTWAAALGREDLYKFMMDNVVPAIPNGCTVCMWSSDTGYEAAMGNGADLSAHGVSEGISYFPSTGKEFLERMRAPLNGLEPIEKSTWYARGDAFLPLLAATHWKLQIPRMVLVSQAVSLCGSASTV